MACRAVACHEAAFLEVHSSPEEASSLGVIRDDRTYQAQGACHAFQELRVDCLAEQGTLAIVTISYIHREIEGSLARWWLIDQFKI